MKSKPSSKIGLPSNSKLFLFTTRISDVSDLNFLKTSSSTVSEQKKSSHLFGLICRPTSLAVLIILLKFSKTISGTSAIVASSRYQTFNSVVFELYYGFCVFRGKKHTYTRKGYKITGLS
jgi:hypothetical protein